MLRFIGDHLRPALAKSMKKIHKACKNMFRDNKVETASCPAKVTKVLFLDIDGVIQKYGNGQRFERNNEGVLPKLYEDLKNIHNIDYSKYDEYDFLAVYYDWDKEAVTLIKKILDESGAKIVLSSDWRFFGMGQMRDFFTLHSLQDYYVDQTQKLSKKMKKKILSKYKKQTTIVPRHCRTLEILKYLDDYPQIKHFVAIDDMNLNPGLENHFVKTSNRIKEEEALEALKCLRRRMLIRTS
jgi:hypothetical protein